MNSLKIKTLVCFALFTTPVHAEPQSICEFGVTIFFVNGMNTDRVGTHKQRNLLQDAFDAHIKGTILENRVRYAVATNPTEGFILDFFEAFQQRSNVEKKEALRHLVEEANWVSDSVKDLLQTQMEQAIDEAATNPYVPKHAEMYNNELKKGQRVIALAYSQGNYFAIQAYDHIDPDYRDRWGMISIGSPASFVVKNGAHTTLVSDTTMANIPGSLPGNVVNFPDEPNPLDETGHYFTESYMAENSPSKKKILADLVTQANELENYGLEQEVLAWSSTLSWSGYNSSTLEETLIHMHVFEPDGGHIYPKNIAGFGQLNLDDEDNGGPVHYQQFCDDVVTGEYLIGLNYFEKPGDGECDDACFDPDRHWVDTDLSITMQTPLENQTYADERRLIERIGLPGEESPTLIYRVILSELPEIGYSYSVEAIESTP